MNNLKSYFNNSAFKVIYNCGILFSDVKDDKAFQNAWWKSLCIIFFWAMCSFPKPLKIKPVFIVHIHVHVHVELWAECIEPLNVWNCQRCYSVGHV